MPAAGTPWLLTVPKMPIGGSVYETRGRNRRTAPTVVVAIGLCPDPRSDEKAAWLWMVVPGWTTLAWKLSVMTPLVVMTPDQLMTCAVWVNTPWLADRLPVWNTRLSGRVSVSTVAAGLTTDVLVRVML